MANTPGRLSKSANSGAGKYKAGGQQDELVVVRACVTLGRGMSRVLPATLLFVAVGLVLGGLVLADSGPHGSYSALTDACGGCHRAHTGLYGRLLIGGPLISDFCLVCHGSTGNGADTNVEDGVYLERDATAELPAQGVHGRGLKGGGFVHAVMDTDADGSAAITSTTSSHLMDGDTGTAWGYGPITSTVYPGATDFSLSCVSCHDPHGGGTYRILRPIPADSGAITPVVVSDVVAKTYTVFTPSNNYMLEEYGTLGGQLGSWCSQCHRRYQAPSGSGHTDSGDPTFRYRHTTTTVSCVRCHVAHGTVAAMGDYSGAVLWPDTSTTPSGDARSALLRLDNRGVCAYCHVDSDGNVGGCSSCHGQPSETGGHTTHFSPVPMGPQFASDSCGDCHLFSEATHRDGQVSFIDGQPLATTTACDGCHSPEGDYDGVNDPVIGAKPNWAEGVYGSTSLKLGKEKWCAGCHDDVPSVIQGVSAPKVVGDEDASISYGTGYGYYKTGHGLPSSEVYPWTKKPGSPQERVGAGLSCENCHDCSIEHIDGNARTYESGTPVDYQNGYRLASVSGQVPLVIPRWNECGESGVDADEFRLCFGCHDSEPFTNSSSTQTNLRDDPSFRNSHYNHLSIEAVCGPGPAFESDWGSTADSRVSCVLCHNVHGSTQLSMVRDGKLVAREPGLQVVYYNDTVSYLCGGPGSHPPTPPNVTLPDSTGTVWNPNVGSFCAQGCHGSCGFDVRYMRTPFDITGPQISHVYGHVGRDVLTARFSEGVYSDVGAVGDLTPADFALNDADNGRTILGVSHTAGDAIAILTLSSSLDAVDDVGTDTLAAATAASIYDVMQNPMDTTAITILDDDAAPPAISNQNPAHSDTGVAVDSNLTFILSDGGSGVDWATFSIQLSGNKGYSETYTYADTAMVSKTGTPDSYDVTVNPDTDFGNDELVTVVVNVKDLADNSFVPSAWSFTTTAGGTPETLTLHPSGLASEGSGGFAPNPGSTWADALDSNDGDVTYVSMCCSGPYNIFYVDMDDPTGIGAGDTINSVTFYAVVRNSSALPVDVGYKTGTNTQWMGDTTVGTSYQLLTSPAYTTNSDGGAWTLADLNNLKVAVKRNYSGPPRCWVTEVYAEIDHNP